MQENSYMDRRSFLKKSALGVMWGLLTIGTGNSFGLNNKEKKNE